jgi:hypothetical protein
MALLVEGTKRHQKAPLLSINSSHEFCDDEVKKVDQTMISTVQHTCGTQSKKIR